MKSKKFFLLMLMALLFPLSSVNAQNSNEINLEAGYVDPDTGNDSGQRSSIQIPHIGIEDYTLFFYTPCNGCTLRLLSSSGNVEYSTVIASGTTSLVLPSYLSGTYEIQIIQGSFYFWGYINL